MSLPPLATAADLTMLGIAIPPGISATALLDGVSAAIRDAAGCPITLTTSVVTIGAGRGQWLDLPSQPVASVDSLAMDGVPVTDWKLVDGRLWRECGWQHGSTPVNITVSFTHGYVVVPQDIVNLACMLAAPALQAAADGFSTPRGIESVAIDDYRETRTTGTSEIVDPTEIPERTRTALRARFSASAAVVGARR